MFEHALLESARHIPGVRRTYSTAASLLLQAAALAMFVVVPILSTQIAPQLQLRQLIVVPQLTSPAPPVESSNAPAGTSPFSTTAPLRQPRTIPALDHSTRDIDSPPMLLHTVGIGNDHANLSSLFADSGRQVLLRSEEIRKPPVISVMEAGVVLSRVQPLYPQIAIVNRIQGTVHLNAVITPSGTLDELRILSGQPVLAQAAVNAVRQWKFRPYVLNGKPIEVQTEVIVRFSLD